MDIVIIVLVFIGVLYLLAIRGKSGHPGLAELKKWSYAHRGLHNQARPENSMSAFRAALEKGYGIELDVHLLKDGNLAVIHDSTLKRTTGAEGKVEDLTTEELTRYHLNGTSETIPTFRQVLDLYAGRAPLIVELKTDGSNHAQLCQKASDMLAEYKGPYCVESFDPRCVIWFKRNRPDVIRGQLTENWFRSESTLPWILKFVLYTQIENFLCVPDFVAFKYSDRRTVGNFLVRKFWGVQGVTWTLKSKNAYDTAVKEGWIPIFEGFEP